MNNYDLAFLGICVIGGVVNGAIVLHHSLTAAAFVVLAPCVCWILGRHSATHDIARRMRRG